MSNVTSLSRKPTARELLAGIKFIDVDTHISEWPELWTERAPAKLRHRMPRIVGEGQDRKWVIDEDKFLFPLGAASAVLKDGSKMRGMGFVDLQLGDVHEACYDVAARLKLMDEHGVHAQIAYPNVLGFAGLAAMQTDAELRLAAIQIFNDAMGDLQKASGDRIFPMAMLPWWDVEASVREAERCLTWGARGININPDPHDHGVPSLDCAEWKPLWELCSSNRLPVNFHIGASDQSISWVTEAPWPTFDANTRLGLGGVMLFISNLRVLVNILASRFLENYPDLKIVSVESGAGWIPYLLEALEYMSVESAVEYRIAPSEIFRRQIYACTFFERRNFIDTVRQVGADNIMFETDFPHPACLYPDGLDYMVDVLADLTEEERFKIFSGNAAKLYNIDIG